MHKHHRMSWLVGIVATITGIVTVYTLLNNAAELELRDNDDQSLISEPPIVQLERIKAASYANHIEVQGFVSSLWSGNLKSQVSGQVIHVSKKMLVGAVFEKGEVLVAIDDIQHRQFLAAAKVQLAIALLSLKEERKRAKRAKSDWENAGLSGKADPLVLRKPQLRVANAQFKAAKEAVELAQYNLNRTSIRAPYDGAVRLREVSIGDFIEVGSTVANIYATQQIQVGLSLSLLQMSQLAVDAGALIELTSIQSTKQWPATVVRVGGEMSRQERSQKIFVELKTQPQLPLVGEFVSARLTGRIQPRLLRVPEAGISKTKQVWYLNAAQKLDKFDAQVAFVQKGFVYVKAPEKLNFIDVVLSPSSQFFVGLSVRSSEQKEEEDTQLDNLKKPDLAEELFENDCCSDENPNCESVNADNQECNQ